jgi:hypothetical protein
MSAVHLEIESANGNLDLSAYINVQAGAGLDPSDPAFSSKVFAHSLLKQGGTLALEDLKLKEMTFPLTLKATTKDKLTALVREINTIIETPGCEVEWSDEGTAISTFFQLASGQFDVEFDFRQGQQSNPMLKGRLRLFVQPLGQLEKTPRSLVQPGGGATLTGSVPVLVFHGASPVRGDAPSLIEAFVGMPATTSFAAFSVLPSASYNPWQPATPALLTTGWTATRTAGEGPFLVGMGNANPIYQQLPGGVYTGQNRVLVLAKRLNAATPAKIGVEQEAEDLTNPFIAASEPQAAEVPNTSGVFTLVDCGVLNRPSLAGEVWNYRISSTATVAIAGVVVLPENTTSWLLDTTTSPGSQVIFSGPKGAVWEQTSHLLDRSGSARGAMPAALPAATAPTFAFLSLAGVSGAIYSTRSHYVNVLEQTRYSF